MAVENGEICASVDESDFRHQFEGGVCEAKEPSRRSQGERLTSAARAEVFGVRKQTFGQDSSEQGEGFDGL